MKRDHKINTSTKKTSKIIILHETEEQEGRICLVPNLS